MAYVFQEGTSFQMLISVVPGRERTFFVQQRANDIDDMLAGSCTT